MVAAGRAVLPAVSHQLQAARIMYQSVCADMWAGMFDVAKEMGLQQTIPTRDQFRSACSENDSRSISEHVLRNLPRVRLHDTKHVVLAIYTETEHPMYVYEDA